MARIFLSNLGCKLNQAEIEAYARRFASDGHELVSDLAQADLHVVNTCTVTHLAARDSRKLARRAARVSMNCKTVLTGCYATQQQAAAAALDGVSLIVENARKDALVDHLYAEFPDLAPTPQASPEGPVPFVPLLFGNVRGALKVEDGCNMTCAFCIIPQTRGRQRSRSIERVVTDLNLLVKRGYQEVVVTGVQISSYRDQDQRLADLVRALLAETDVPRLRLTSIAPWQFDLGLLDLWPNERLCRHFHLSLQSGCTETLHRMRRPYSSEQYRNLLAAIRDRIPGVAITTDVIVGFPSESEAEFERSLHFVQDCGFARTHVFPYSEREGTRSAAMKDSVSPQEKKQRVRLMRAVAATASANFARQQKGQRLQVLWEREINDGAGLAGTSDNYLRVHGGRLDGTRIGDLTKVVAAQCDGEALETVAGAQAREQESANGHLAPASGLRVLTS